MSGTISMAGFSKSFPCFNIFFISLMVLIFKIGFLLLVGSFKVKLFNTNDEIRLFKVSVKNSGGLILKPHVHLEYGIYETAELVKFGSKEKTIYPDEIIEFELEISKKNITSSGQIAVILDYGHNTQIEGAVLEISP